MKNFLGKLVKVLVIIMVALTIIITMTYLLCTSLIYLNGVVNKCALEAQVISVFSEEMGQEHYEECILNTLKRDMNRSGILLMDMGRNLL